VNVFNLEIKARTDNADHVRRKLYEHGADYRGKDHQIDTYFEIKSGRLKIREGNIEKSLIYYERENIADPKGSKVLLYNTERVDELKHILLRVLDVKVIVDKIREIYFIENVKFHIDTVNSLGEFIEIEIINTDDTININRMRELCHFYMREFNILEKHLIHVSYSDLILSNL